VTGYVGVKEAAKFLGVAEGTMYYWKHKGVIPYYKFQGKVLFKLNELDKCVKSYGRVDGKAKAW